MSNEDISILILDDEEGMVSLLEAIVKDSGYTPVSFTSPNKAMQYLQKARVDIAIVDIRMPEMDGLSFLTKAHELDPHLPVVMITAYGSIENAVACVKVGAFDYITKPFQNDEIIIAVDKVLERRRLINENNDLKMRLSGIDHAPVIVGKSRKILEVTALARRIADGKSKILLTGESGTGKDMLAAYIHAVSPRRDKRFVPVQCGLLPENLLESELFGHRKGSFTGATDNKIGLFEDADGGTVYLDEIGDIAANVQSKLLRFIDENTIRPVGETRSKMLDVRLISATNKDLAALVKKKRFREDLYYRLKVVTITMPPLRERKEDIPALAVHFLSLLNKENGRHIELSSDCIPMLMSNRWEGNIRELKHCIESAYAVCEEDVITTREIAHVLAYSGDEGGLSGTFKERKQKTISYFERGYLAELLTKYKGNIAKASKSAGMNKKNLWLLLKKYGFKYSDFRRVEK